jgi:hypothetical protein
MLKKKAILGPCLYKFISLIMTTAKRLLLLLNIVPFFSFAQSHYRPGAIVNLKGDTLKGFIDYHAWDSNPTSVNFKSALNDPDKQTFSVHNASYFSITGLATYRKYVVSISTDETDINRLGEARDTSFKMDTVFLKVLEQGKTMALYSYGDERKMRFYIAEAPSFVPVELVYRLWHDAGHEGGHTVYDNGYQKQLFALAIKYNALDDKLSAMFNDPYLSYREDLLLAIVSGINHTSAAELKASSGAKSKLSFYLGVLGNISKTSSSAQSQYSLAGGTSYTSYLPGLSLGADLFPDPDGGKIEFRLDLSYAPTKMDAVYTFTISPYTRAEASYNQTELMLSPQVLYNFYNAPGFKFFLGAGLDVGSLSYSNPYFGQHDRSQAQGNFPTDSYIFQKLNTTFLFKAGFRIHKNWEIHVDYYTSDPAVFAGYFDLGNQNTVVGVNYFFGQ